MGIKSYKPTTPSRRYMQTADFSDLSKKPALEKKLTHARKTGGRNNLGRITCRHKGGGHKRQFRPIDFKRDKEGIAAKVAALEYDPNRTANIALLNYADGEKRYILAPMDLKVGDVITSGQNAEIKPGNCLQLRYMPLGTTIHNLELKPGRGAQMIRSAGSSGQIMAKEGGYVQVRLPTGEVRLIKEECRGTVGQVGNVDHINITYGKAGKTIWLGIRPTVRGVAMNPVDHPMGGGEGKTSGGRHPCSPWGWKTKGLKTRSKKKTSNKFIVKRRK